MSDKSATSKSKSKESQNAELSPAQLEFARVIGVELVQRWMERSSSLTGSVSQVKSGVNIDGHPNLPK
jgi:hypothetical protein